MGYAGWNGNEPSLRTADKADWLPGASDCYAISGRNKPHKRMDKASQVKEWMQSPGCNTSKSLVEKNTGTWPVEFLKLHRYMTGRIGSPDVRDVGRRKKALYTVSANSWCWQEKPLLREDWQLKQRYLRVLTTSQILEFCRKSQYTQKLCECKGHNV